MIERTKISHALNGEHGCQAVNMSLLEKVLMTLGQMLLDFPSIKEIDINPLLATPEEVKVLDARIILHDHSIPVSLLPRPVIRPYPAQYVSRAVLRDGTPITIRPIRPEDRASDVEFS